MQRIAISAVKITAAVFSCLVLFTACENKEQTNHYSEQKNIENMKGHNHNHSHTGTEKKYDITFKSEPSNMEAVKPAKLYFRPEEVGNSSSVVTLDLVHEMKVHLFIMSKDLSYFAHEHPDIVADGSYVWEHTFPTGGEYILFQDYTPSGSGHQLGKQEIKVSGEEAPARKLGEENLTWESSGYKAILSAEQPVKANASIELKASVYKNGKPVTDLDDYLGALAHVVIVSENADEFVHVHPMESETSGPDILLHTNFPKKGKYKVFMQFKHEGKVHTSSFVINVV
ncbi:hypothetical protein AAE02nite_21080 [Adhaeribacter aerolatus]|uniref:Secreted protein n=1 Tax=Adhaeribacter aerolatus TaxID=670289 RepID=A0A512AXL9_9BACT|nr:hypothetical protein [Adhaeribacter aerolatus]GEO04444.1 hypothetical protein AAE02nite_21080 [Adhaeribacter aerolatus]